MPKDIRWQQRFANYKKALQKLKEAAALDLENMSDLEKECMIQRFEYTHELAWNTLRDFLRYQGVVTQMIGSRDTTREAFSSGIIRSGDIWMEMIKSRNLTSHTYNEDTANAIFSRIVVDFLPLFLELEATFQQQIEEKK